MNLINKALKGLRHRIVRTPNEAFDLGCYAMRWTLHPGGRFISVSSFHEVNGFGPEGIGPLKLYFFAGNLKRQHDEFLEGTCK